MSAAAFCGSEARMAIVSPGRSLSMTSINSPDSSMTSSASSGLARPRSATSSYTVERYGRSVR